MNGSTSTQAFAENAPFTESGYDDEAFENAVLAEYDYDDDDDETFAAEDDYDYDDESTEAEFLAGLAAPLISGAATTAINGIRSVSNLFKAPSRPRQFRRPAPAASGGGGVRTARLNTPRGSASMQLPAAVPTLTQYLATTRKLQTQIGNLTTGLNRTQSDLHKERQRITQTAVLAASNKDNLAKFRLSTRKVLGQQKRELAAFKKEQSSQAMMNLMLGMMQMQRIRDDITSHTHSGVVLNSTGATTGDLVEVSSSQSVDSDDNSMMMLLPLLMGQQGGGDNMLPFMLMALAD
ncbi:MAG: hypothetical protein WD314_02945 [Trueperaceae bacterium]